MKFKIEWQAIVGKHRLQVSGAECVEAETSSQALDVAGSAVLAKLSTLNNPFAVTNLRFINVGVPIQISAKHQFAVLNSLNAEGGLMGNIPKAPPTAVKVNRDKNGNVTLSPIYTPRTGSNGGE